MFRPYLNLLLAGVLLFAASCSKDEEIDPTAPFACFNISGDIYAEAGAAFNSDCSKNATIFYWEFGDGDYSTEANPTHIYDKEGSYKVTLTVRSDVNGTHSVSKDIAVKASPFIKHSGYIDEAEVWEEGLHLVTGKVTIRHGSLTIKPGAVIYMNKTESIYVGHTDTQTAGGALFTAEGTATKPIKFLPASGVETGGEWGHIFFTSKASTASSLKYCEIKYGGKADATWDYDYWTYYTDHGTVDVNGTSVTIENTTITGAANFGISVWENSSFNSFINNTVTDNASYPVWIHFNFAHTIGTGNTFNGKGILLHSQYFNNAGEVTWNKLDVPYLLDGAKSISSGTIRIAPGTTVALMKGASLDGNGTLIAEGTVAEPILFTSAEETKAKGDWRGISTGGGSVMKYCIIEYGGGPTFNNSRRMVVPGGVMENCTIRHSAGNGVVLGNNDLSTTFLSNAVTDCDNYAVTLYAANLHTLNLNNTIGADTKGVYISGAYGIQGDVTWVKRPYDVHVGGIVIVQSYEFSRLTIAPGSNITFLPGSGMKVAYESAVHGVLIAEGTEAERITFTLAESSNDGSNFWSGIMFGISTTAESRLVNCDFSYGGTPSDNLYGMIHFNRTTDAPILTNCSVSHAGNFGLSFNQATPQISGTTFSNNPQDEYVW